MIAPIGVDSFVKENVPAANFGDTPRIWVNGGGSGDQRFAYLYHSRPCPIGARILSAKLRLYLNGSWSGTNNLTLKRITSTWAEGKLTWNNKPTVTATNSAAATVTGGTDGQVVEFDITNMMVDIASALPFFGFRVELSQHQDRAFYSSDNGVSTLRPEFEVNWTLAPDPPGNLSPSAGDIVSSALPQLSWTMSFPGGGSLTSSEVQISTSTDFTTPEYDSGKQPNTSAAIWDLYANNLNLMALANQADFETDATTGIVFIAGSTKTKDTTTFNHGAASLKVTTPGSVANEGVGFGSAAGSTTNDAIATAGNTYTFSMAMKGNAGGESVQLVMFWRTAAGAAISTSASSAIVLTTSWTTYSFTATAPATTAFVELAVRTSGTSAVTWFNDTAQFEIGSNVSPWSLPTGYTGIPLNGTRFWRVRIWDDVDTVSGWSDPVSMTRTSLGALSISSPGATTGDLTPPITWSLSGQTQESYRVTLMQVATSGKLIGLWSTSGVGATTSVTVPANIIQTGKTYRARVEVWDTLNRANNEHQTAEQTFTYVRAGTVAAVETLNTITYNDGTRNTPVVQVTVTRSAQPDYWSVKLNGVEYNSRIVASTTFVSGTTYRFYLWGVSPRTATTVEVEAVVLSGGVFKHSTGNPTTTVTTSFTGVWLADDTLTSTLGQMVPIFGVDGADMSIGESGTTYDVIGSRSPVRLTDTIQGYRGTISGNVLSKAERDTFLALKDLSLNQDLRLVVGDLSIPVRLESAAAAPRPEPGDVVFDVSFGFFQTAAPWPLTGI